MNQAPAPAPAPRPFAPGDRPSEGPRRDERSPRGGRGGRNRRGGRGGGARRPGSATRKIQRILRRPGANPRPKQQGAEYYPAPAAENVVRIVPLGGVEEVGRNMLAVEIGASGDIFISDVGFHFK